MFIIEVANFVNGEVGTARKFDEFNSRNAAESAFADLLTLQKELGEDAQYDALRLEDPSGKTLQIMHRCGKEFVVPCPF